MTHLVFCTHTNEEEGNLKTFFQTHTSSNPNFLTDEKSVHMARGSSSRSFFIYSVSGRTLCHARTPFFAHFSQSWHLFNSQRMEWILIIQTPTDLLLLIMDLEKIDRHYYHNYFLDGQMGKKYFKTFNDITFHLWILS